MNITVTDAHQPHLGGNYRHGDLACLSFSMWKALVNRYAVSSVLDVGCGEGHAVKYFRSLGLVAHGIDGLGINVTRSVTPISLHDLNGGPFVMPVDMTLSVEVAEHIEEQYVDNYISTLCNGKLIVMTHAIPGQQGHHHVNLQPAEYWIAKFAAKGYYLDANNEFWRSRSSDDGHFTYFTRSGLVFLRGI